LDRHVLGDLAAATEFFVELGLKLHGEGSVEGRWVDRIVGLEGVRTDFAFMQTPDGHGRLELIKFHTPSHQGDKRHAPATTPGIRHLAFVVDNIDAVVARLRARGAELVGRSRATRTATGSAISAARREPSSSSRSRSAKGSRSRSPYGAEPTQPAAVARKDHIRENGSATCDRLPLPRTRRPAGLDRKLAGALPRPRRPARRGGRPRA
jgi:catechol 2,3-dioxygenase-like lactoylglutathione lyase family enzyme